MKRQIPLLLRRAALVCGLLFIGGWILVFSAERRFFNPRLQGLGCTSNLRMIDAMKEQAAQELNLARTDIPTEAQITPYIKGNQMPKCPAGGIYSINPMNKPPTCSLRPADRSSSGHQLPE